MIDSEVSKARPGGKVYTRTVAASCICVLCIILLAGLWPLHVPSNKVSWLESHNGLRFRQYGSVFSIGALRNDELKDTSGSLEIWLNPSWMDDSKTILSFADSAHPGDPLSIQQNKSGLRILRQNLDDRGTSRTAWSTVDNVFRLDRPVFVSITLGEHDASVYVDGNLRKVCSLYGSSGNDLTGRIIVADSPSTSYNWSGQILGLAIYHRRLSAAQVARHWETWTTALHPVLETGEAPVAVYLLDERKGNVVHNQLDSSTDLVIPSHYSVLHPNFLLRPWREYKNTWSYWQDFAVNITGFIPFGFCFVAWFTIQRIRHPRTIAIVFGLAVSVMIEVSQAYIPTRSSGMTDLLTNTLGTAMGVILYDCWFTQRLLSAAKERLNSNPRFPTWQQENKRNEVGSGV